MTFLLRTVTNHLKTITLIIKKDFPLFKFNTVLLYYDECKSGVCCTGMFS